MQVPAVSVIIPLYNAEKYIGECLDSILAQTFTNFEVIVVDDCSTDNSVAIVKSYREKFGERLTLSKTKKNSGGGGYVPRNIGLGLSRGEYIFFVDADDFIAKNALEFLHAAAKNSGADVVYTGAYYSCNGDNSTKLIRDKEGHLLLDSGREDKPTLTIDNTQVNLQRLLVMESFRNPWTKFTRREFLIENEIIFPKIFSGGDFIWNIQLCCYSRRFLRVPIPLYFYREYSAESVTRKKRSVAEQNSYWISAFVHWVKALNALSDETAVLKENPVYCYAALQGHFEYCLRCFSNERMQLKPQEIYEILSREFAGDPSAATVPFLFSVIDGQQKNQLVMQQKFNQFAAQTQSRIAELENEIRRLTSKE